MKLSANTIATLKNFSSINAGLVIKGPTDTLKSISIMRNIVVQAKIEEELPECAFYNLPELLSVISLFKDPDVEFMDKYVIIGNGRSKVKYSYSDPAVIVAPTKDITPPPMDISFSISQESLAELIKSAAVLQLPDVVVEGDGEGITISAKDIKNPSSNTFSQEVSNASEYDATSFSMVFKAESLQKLRPGSYDVEISSRKISRWTGESNDTVYFLSLESTSKYEE